jgi:large subunit ribosomal protein L10
VCFLSAVNAVFLFKKMPLTREQKKKITEDLEEKIARQKAMIFVDFTGLKVKDLSDLRKKLRTENSELKVAKKTMLGLVFKKAGLAIEAKEIKGEIALILGYNDGLSLAKTVYQFAEANPNLKILGGFFEKKFQEAEEIITLAQLPTREELLARLVGTVLAPVSNFVNVLQGNIKGLIYALSGIKK